MCHRCRDTDISGTFIAAGGGETRKISWQLDPTYLHIARKDLTCDDR